jgi:hypothetical protein
MNCQNCGAAVAASQKFCDICGARVEEREEAAAADRVTAAMAMEAPEMPGIPGSGRSAGIGPATLPGSPICLGDDEHILREYKAVQLRTRKRGEGTLYVTDARVVFFARAEGRGTQRASLLVQQTRMKDITGVAAFVSRRISLILAGLTVLAALITIGTLLNGDLLRAVFFLVLTAAGVTAILAGAAQRGRAGVRIYSRDTGASPIHFGGGFANQRGVMEALISFFLFPLLVFVRAQSAFDVLLGRPGDDSERIIAELGALILDLQTRGILAAEHWGVAIDKVPARGQARG